MKATKFLALTIAIMAAIFGVAATKKPVRIVCLPIIFQNKIDTETRNELEIKIARAVHIPLNETLNAAEYLDAEKSAATLEKIQRDDKNLSDAVKILAEELDADLVICPILRHRFERVVHPVRFDSETRLSSHAAAQLIVYDRRTNDLADKKTSRSYSGNYSKFSTAQNLAAECFDELIKKTGLREIIRAIG